MADKKQVQITVASEVKRTIKEDFVAWTNREQVGPQEQVVVTFARAPKK